MPEEEVVIDEPEIQTREEVKEADIQEPIIEPIVPVPSLEPIPEPVTPPEPELPTPPTEETPSSPIPEP